LTGLHRPAEELEGPAASQSCKNHQPGREERHNKSAELRDCTFVAEPHAGFVAEQVDHFQAQ
jgi:hypothetical protein